MRARPSHFSGDSEDVVLDVRGIVKHFPGVCALDAVDFELRRG